MLGLEKYSAPHSYTSGQKNANFNPIHANLASQIPAFSIAFKAVSPDILFNFSLGQPFGAIFG